MLRVRLQDVKEMLAPTNLAFLNADYVRGDFSYWSGYRSYDVELVIDGKYFGLSESKKFTALATMTVAQRGIYVGYCAGLKRKRVKDALQLLKISAMILPFY